MSAICRNCGDSGHVQDYCPRVHCNHCGQQGHLARVCSGTSGSYRPRRQNTNGNRWTAERSPCTSNLHCLPRNWNLSNMYGDSFEEAIAGLKSEGRQFTMQDVEQAEFQAINDLVQRTWQGWRVGHGVDGANLDHTSIEVVKIQRIENPGLYQKYSLLKQHMLQKPKNEWASIYTPVELIKRGTRSVWTTRAMKQGSFLRQNFFTSINEHYLFHGTKEGNVMSMAENGFNINLCLDRGLMGAGIYFAECSTKADMYADFRHKRTQGQKHMLLVRVLLGSSYVNNVKTKLPLEHPPCRNCSQHDCNCGRKDYFDSVVDDSGRLFRVFAVYKSDLCYPEYLITYQRGYDNKEDQGGNNVYGNYEGVGGTTQHSTTVTNVTAWSTSEVSSWSGESLATSRGSQLSSEISSRPQPSFSSGRSSDQGSSSHSSRGVLGRIWDFFFG